MKDVILNILRIKKNEDVDDKELITFDSINYFPLFTLITFTTY